MPTLTATRNSNVQKLYSTNANKNIKLGSLSLEEGKTRYKDINDLFRKLMADIRQDSNEIRSGLSSTVANIDSAINTAAQAKAAADDAKGYVGSFSSRIAGAEGSIQEVTSRINSNTTAVNNAMETAAGAAADAQTALTTAANNAAEIILLKSSVGSLQSAAAENSGYSLVDGETVEYRNGDLTVKDVAVEGDLTDLASARGQIGRTGMYTSALDTLLTDGWYAVGGEDLSGVPEGFVQGVCRTASGYAEGTCVQTLWSVESEGEPRTWVRSTSDSGLNWTDWRELLAAAALSTDFVIEDGVLHVVFPDVLPEMPDNGESLVLSAGGEWVERVSAEDLAAVQDSVDAVAESVATLETSLDALNEAVGAEPDGETVVVIDGQYSVPVYTGAAEEDSGIAGLVPPADPEDAGKYLRGDGTWGEPAFDLSAYVGATDEEDGTAGLVPAAEMDERELFLRGDGSWGDPCEALAERVSVLEDADPAQYGDRISSLEYSLANEGEAASDIDAIFWPPAAPEEEEEEQGGGE